MASDAASRHFRLERVAPGVHIAIARPDGWALCNAGIVDLGGSTLVFDAMLTPSAGEALRRAARRLTGRSPDWVVNSHWHGDHIWGTSALGAPHVASTRKVREGIQRRSRGQWKECRREFPRELRELSRPGNSVPGPDRRRLRAWFEGVVRAPASFPIVLPDVTFDDTLRLTGTRRSIDLISYGGGHSPSDVFGYLEEEGLIFAGDLAMVGLHPSVTDGWLDRWTAILRRMEKLRARHILPGHGPLGGRDTLPTVRRYLGDLATVAHRAVEAGTPLARLREQPIPDRYARWQFTMMYPENLARAYRLARQGRRRRA